MAYTKWYFSIDRPNSSGDVIPCPDESQNAKFKPAVKNSDTTQESLGRSMK